MTKNLKGTDKVLNLKEIEVVEIDTLNSSFCSGRVNTREKSPAFKLEYHLLISPGSHKTPNKPRLLSRGKNPKGFVILSFLKFCAKYFVKLLHSGSSQGKRVVLSLTKLPRSPYTESQLGYG